jgi:hypothetical protein
LIVDSIDYAYYSSMHLSALSLEGKEDLKGKLEKISGPRKAGRPTLASKGGYGDVVRNIPKRNMG